MFRGSQSHCRPTLCLSLAGQLVLPGWLQLIAGQQALPAKILAYLGTNTCLRWPNRYPGHWPMGFPDSRGPGNLNCSAHCAGPGNGSSQHSVMDLCGGWTIWIMQILRFHKRMLCNMMRICLLFQWNTENNSPIKWLKGPVYLIRRRRKGPLKVTACSRYMVLPGRI